MQNSPASDDQQQPAATASETEPRAEQDDLSVELERLEDRYKRALADLDNYRKRAARESERRVEEVRALVVRDWLDVVDSVERAMEMQSDGPCFEGLRAVHEQMETVLQREGAQRVGSAGDQFDPSRHEAIAVQPSAEVPDRTVMAVQRSGFALGDRLIRPAQVVVARTPEHAD